MNWRVKNVGLYLMSPRNVYKKNQFIEHLGWNISEICDNEIYGLEIVRTVVEKFCKNITRSWSIAIIY